MRYVLLLLILSCQPSIHRCPEKQIEPNIWIGQYKSKTSHARITRDSVIVKLNMTVFRLKISECITRKTDSTFYISDTVDEFLLEPNKLTYTQDSVYYEYLNFKKL